MFFLLFFDFFFLFYDIVLDHFQGYSQDIIYLLIW